MQEALRIARRERTQTRTRGMALGRSDDAEWLAAVRMSRKRGLDAVLPGKHSPAEDASKGGSGPDDGSQQHAGSGKASVDGRGTKHADDAPHIDEQKGGLQEEAVPRYLTGSRFRDPLLQEGPLVLGGAAEQASSSGANVNNELGIDGNDGRVDALRPLLRRRLFGSRSVASHCFHVTDGLCVATYAVLACLFVRCRVILCMVHANAHAHKHNTRL